MKSPTKPPQLLIHGYRLELTCSACPEQYDVFDQAGTMVAYFRLRHGNFTVSVPDYGGEVVYIASPQGDGIFEDSERLAYLVRGIEAVQAHIANFNIDCRTDY
jgi:hypothetical protein